VDDTAPEVSAFDVERSTVTLADVGGMSTVKERLTAAFLAPLRNPELRKLYGKSLRGGLLMYGPPGCGKTFIARALAGELGAKFISVGISDVLDMYIGASERNVHEVFQLARREAPCVLFFDEIDALGQRRSLTRSSGTRNTVNQLLTELDGIDGANEGVFVLAATNQPWDVDPALRRPGRFDRTALVLPPDLPAREAIFRFHLASRPVEGIDLAALAKASDGLSGADIAYVCEVAAERALTDSALSGVTRLITMKDVTSALREATPSISAWLDSARNVVMFGDGDGTYAELKAYLKKVKRL
jgi:SpoVK/Ycf46/Vps4 family AAA+-type ATPase